MRLLYRRKRPAAQTEGPADPGAKGNRDWLQNDPKWARQISSEGREALRAALAQNPPQTKRAKDWGTKVIEKALGKRPWDRAPKTESKLPVIYRYIDFVLQSPAGVENPSEPPALSLPAHLPGVARRLGSSGVPTVRFLGRDVSTVFYSKLDETRRLHAHPQTQPPRYDHWKVPPAVYWTEGGTRIVTGYEDEVRVWDCKTGKACLAPKSSGRGLQRCRLSPDGASVASYSLGSLVSSVRVSSTATGNITGTLRLPCRLRNLWLSPGGEHLAVLDSSDRLHIREVRTGKFVLRVPKKQQGWKIYWGRGKDYVQWSPDGTLVFIGGQGNHMQQALPAYHMTVYSVGERQEVYTRLGLHQYNISWSPTQPRVFFEGAWVLDGRYSCIDVIAHRTVYSGQQDRPYKPLTYPRWSPNDRFIVGGRYNDMRVVDASNGDIAYDHRTQSPRGSWPVVFNGVRSWSPDSRFIAAACTDRNSGQARVQVWRVADSGSLSFVHSLSVGCNIEAMAWNPQGTHLALLDHDGYLHVRGVHLPNAS